MFSNNPNNPDNLDNLVLLDVNWGREGDDDRDDFTLHQVWKHSSDPSSYSRDNTHSQRHNNNSHYYYPTASNHQHHRHVNVNSRKHDPNSVPKPQQNRYNPSHVTMDQSEAEVK